MGVRAARITDLPAIRNLARNGMATVLAPPEAANVPSAVALGILSSWRGVGNRTRTLMLNQRNLAQGFVQARARPGRESWDIVRLACVASDAQAWERACADLLERISVQTAQRGALRTFARLPEGSERMPLLIELGFRPFATELTLRGVPRQLIDAVPLPGLDVRSRMARDAWDIFSLYSAITPALVRHAEGRSLKEWLLPNRFTSIAVQGWRPIREVVLGQMGELKAWMRWQPAHGSEPQVIELLTWPDATARIPEMLRFAAETQGLDANCVTLCRAREYDGRISATLERGGFDAVLRETLFVRHTVARVTERQLLIAALRAQGLGRELSRYRPGVESIHQRMASSSEAEHHYYDRKDRNDRASSYR